MTNFGNLIAGGAILSVVAACWGQLRSLARWVAGRLVVEVCLNNSILAEHVEEYLMSTFTVGWRFRRVCSLFESYDPGARSSYFMPVDVYPATTVLYWRGWRPILAASVGEAASNADGRTARPRDEFTGQATCRRLLFLRGTFDPDVLLGAAADFEIERRRQRERLVGRYRVQRVGGNGTDLSEYSDGWRAAPSYQARRAAHADPGRFRGCRPPLTSAPFATLAYSPEVMRAVGGIRHWIASEDWYRERCLPWKRGLLLHGAPGCGKTSLVRALGVELDLPIIALDLNAMDDKRLVEAWRNSLRSVSPCIVLLEDFDTVFHGRARAELAPVLYEEAEAGEEVSSTGGRPPSAAAPRPRPGVRFDTLLNLIDGVDGGASYGMLFVITTNRVDLVDPALGGAHGTEDGVPRPRPGRIDMVLELGPVDRDGKRKIAERVCRDQPRALARLLAELDAGADPVETPAQYEFRAGQAALEDHYANLAAGPEPVAA